jgi:hypothetical protein
MRVAGQVVEGLRFAEDSHRDRCAQGQCKLVESSDVLPQQQRQRRTSSYSVLQQKVGRIILVESILIVPFLLIRLACTVRKHGETADGL